MAQRRLRLSPDIINQLNTINQGVRDSGQSELFGQGLVVKGPPTLIRGSLTTFRGAQTGQGAGVRRIFMFNPNDMNDTKGTSWGTIEVPGTSHPVYQFGAGGERLITFSLYVDGDRGRFGRAQPRDVTSLSIKDELTWYRSLVYPIEFGVSAQALFPYTVLYNFGEMYQNVACIVKKVDWQIHYWSPLLQPVRATIPIVLAEIPDGSTTAADVRTLGGLDSTGAPNT